MATGKNKKYKAGSVKKGSKRKIQEPFSKKEWYKVKVPKNFKRRDVGQIVVNKTAGTRIASEQLKGRVVEVNLADLMENEKYGLYNYKFRCEDVNGKDCLMVFHGLKLTTDKLRSIVKKWCTLIETYVDVLLCLKVYEIKKFTAKDIEECKLAIQKNEYLLPFFKDLAYFCTALENIMHNFSLADYRQYKKAVYQRIGE